MATLPMVASRCESVVVVQQCHREYKYARCASLAGARVEWVEDLEAAVADALSLTIGFWYATRMVKKAKKQGKQLDE